MSDIPEKMDRALSEPVWIACKYLSVIWPDAQRRFNPARAKEIKESFDPELVNPIKVLLPNGQGIHHIFDGQHLKSAVEQLWGQNEKLPCIIYPDPTAVHAAKLFIKTNTRRKPPTPVENFLVNVTAKNPAEVAINRVVRQYRFQVAPVSRANTITAVGALQTVYTRGSIKVLDRTLSVLRQAWDGDPTSVCSTIIRAYGEVLTEFGNHVSLARLVEVSKNNIKSASGLLQQARADKDRFRGSVQGHAVKLILRHYNHGQRGSRVLKRKEQTT